ncbi:MotA/TolQ/ExbB proton channel family protein [Sediminitomix flava]|uniref:MotA/TolQ/ExbB proton channel family protein n=1 Tax=Sediminitomix flava TaxID=379075 RepID=A0A315ZF22_SEDFL|nr:MotA/TolQ/ExbB proton channel family protein [Sediminitomix flava]PWJ43760.1 MotA/TolQ/ExbB proton channel family protein [Sediminitomix flava]
MQWFLNFYSNGGSLFMTFVTIPGVLMLVCAVFKALKMSNKFAPIQKSEKLIKELSLLALMMGIFGQLIGLYGAFEAIEAAGGVSMSLLAAGLKISSHTTLYGFLYFVLGRIALVYFAYTDSIEEK